MLRNLLFVCLIMCTLPGFAAAAPLHHHESGMMSPWGAATDAQIDRAVDSLQKSLNLSTTQTSSVRILARTRRDTLQVIRDQARPKYQQLMALLKQPNPDPAAVGRATIEMKAIHDQALAKQADLEKQFMNLLNPTQQQTLNNLRKQAGTYWALHRLGLLGTVEHQLLMNRLESE